MSAGNQTIVTFALHQLFPRNLTHSVPSTQLVSRNTSFPFLTSPSSLKVCVDSQQHFPAESIMQRCCPLLLTFALAALSSCIITASAGSELPPDWQLESGLLPLNSLSGDIVSGPAAPADVDAAAIRKQEAVLTDHGTYTTQGITFECAGSSKCGGMLYLPKKKPATGAQKATNSSTSSAKLPIVVLAHGLGGEKTWLAKFAGVFAGEGIAALTFDYRHWGSSDGTPRQWISVTKQHEDWQAAVKHVQTTQLGGLVDPSRLCLWGTSYGGGHVIFVASKLGSQVKCVISNVSLCVGGARLGSNNSMCVC